MTTGFISLVSSVVFLGLGPIGTAFAQPDATAAAPPLNWRDLERPTLQGHVQLTSRDRFVKAGEAYFSPDGSWVIFQAVAVPADGKSPDAFYSMYVARVARDPGGRILGLEGPTVVSAPGSANTCGWFHPTQPGRVIFGSTVIPPATDQKAGFQVGSRKYVWLFPQETEVCTRTVIEMLSPNQRAGLSGSNKPADLDRAAPLFSRPDYDAECSYSRDGRLVLYAHVREGEKPGGRADADIWVYDTRTGEHHALVTADGYDGGPFFSPDGQRICYRSDRKLDDMLQLFIADLKFDSDGVPIGVEREHQITDNQSVNWAPFWHPSGKFLVYGTSEVSHQNYEVFAMEIDDAKPADPDPGARRHARLTHADGADVLPVFTPDGKWMMWTAQRGAVVAGEQKPSSQLWAAQMSVRPAFGDIPAK